MGVPQEVVQKDGKSSLAGEWGAGGHLMLCPGANT